jgi:tRNA-2-methylthio-N6-dimethylallyladenosine synthase
VKRFAVRTYGCQMNQHDTEKVANLLHHAGWRPAGDEAAADLLLVNTCSIREKAENRLYSDLGLLRAWKAEAPGRLLGVGGCVAQQEGDTLLRRFPQVDFVFGTHNVRLVPQLVASAESGRREARLEEVRDLSRFDLPERHPDWRGSHPGRAFVTVMEGCDMFCTFCIVPRTRGREVSRPADAIEAEVRDLAARGVREITLLGQTVNAYGRHAVRRGRSRPGPAEPVDFATLLRRLAAVPGLARIRYTSPHPLFFDEDLCRAHGELENLCPHVHLPLQSGADAVLARMRRRHDADAYRRVVERLRRARPDVALTTDLIVGFPGESEAEFRATLDLVAEVGFVDAYSFKYSPRPGTRAADAAGQVPPDEAQARLEALQAQLRAQTLAAHRARVGGVSEILVEGASRRGGQLMGRDPYHRVVNVAAAPGAPAPGTLAPVRIIEATPHSLIGELMVKERPEFADESGGEGSGPPGGLAPTGTFPA